MPQMGRRVMFHKIDARLICVKSVTVYSDCIIIEKDMTIL